MIRTNIAELTCHSPTGKTSSRWPRDTFVNLFGIVGKQVESQVSSHQALSRLSFEKFQASADADDGPSLTHCSPIDSLQDITNLANLQKVCRLHSFMSGKSL